MNSRKCHLCGKFFIGDDRLCIDCQKNKDMFYGENDLPDIFKEMFGSRKDKK